MNDKLEIEYEHLSNGYWKASFILSSKKLDKIILIGLIVKFLC